MKPGSSLKTSCPVPLELLALLVRCDEARLAATVGELPDARRAALAAYCFDRYHMRRLGFAVARHCTERSLEAAAAGRHLFELSRNAAEPGFEAASRPKRTVAPEKVAA